MNVKEIGKELVELCNQGKNMECVEKFYSDDIVSVEASAPQSGGEQVMKGIEAIKGKGQWWAENHEIHSAKVEGPFPHGEDRFAAIFNYDITNKPSGQRIQMHEVGVFHVANGKIVREEFFYDM